MKIYIEKSKNIEDIEKKIKKKYVGKTYENINILTKRGIYKIKNNSIFLYKMKDTMTQKIKFKSFVLLFTEVIWEKKEESENIPFNHHFLKKNITEYTIKDDFKIVFETIKDKIYDFYFTTKLQNIKEIEKRIGSLLSILK